MTATLLTPPGATETFAISLRLLDGYAFRVDFDAESVATLTTDERSPLGDDRGPSPSRLLAAAVGNCLAASLLHCLRKAQVEVRELDVRVVTALERNDAGRLRIAHIEVALDPHLDAALAGRLGRCASLFEQYCIVTESVRRGIAVHASIAGAAGA